MIEIRVNKNMAEQDHHEYEYKEGKKIPKKDNGIRYAYIDKYGLFHVTKWEDEASEFGNGIYAVTDEMECENGLPVINDEIYKVWGADDCSVKLSSRGEERFYVNNKSKDNKVVVSKGNEKKKAVYNAIREIYIAIESKTKEEKAK